MKITDKIHELTDDKVSDSHLEIYTELLDEMQGQKQRDKLNFLLDLERELTKREGA